MPLPTKAAISPVEESLPMAIGAMEFTTCELTDRNYADLEGWVRAKILSIAAQAAKLAPDLSSVIMPEAFSTALRVTSGTEEFANVIKTDEGIWRLGHAYIQKRHGAISYAEFERECLKNIDAAREAIVLVHSAWRAKSATLLEAEADSKKVGGQSQ